MWKRIKLWASKNRERRHRENAKKVMDETLAKVQKSQEQKYMLWKDRASAAQAEIPGRVFQILQNQHNIGKDDS